MKNKITKDHPVMNSLNSLEKQLHNGYPTYPIISKGYYKF